MRSVLFLVSKGIPYEKVFKLKLKQLRAFCIIMSELELPEEQHFDFERMRFREAKK